MIEKDQKTCKNTQTRITTVSAAMLRKLARELYTGEQEAHERHGLKTPSSRVAIDYLIYEASKAGIGSWPTLTEKNNLWMMITADAKEE